MNICLILIQAADRWPDLALAWLELEQLETTLSLIRMIRHGTHGSGNGVGDSGGSSQSSDHALLHRFFAQSEHIAPVPTCVTYVPSVQSHHSS